MLDPSISAWPSTLPLSFPFQKVALSMQLFTRRSYNWSRLPYMSLTVASAVSLDLLTLWASIWAGIIRICCSELARSGACALGKEWRRGERAEQFCGAAREEAEAGHGSAPAVHQKDLVPSAVRLTSPAPSTTGEPALCELSSPGLRREAIIVKRVAVSAMLSVNIHWYVSTILCLKDTSLHHVSFWNKSYLLITSRYLSLSSLFYCS